MFNINKKLKGSILFFGLVIISVVLLIALGLTNILISQFMILRGIGDSVIAFYAADSGVEEVLYELYKNSNFVEITKDLTIAPNSYAHYTTKAIPPGPNCLGSFYCIYSNGTFNQQKRAIQAAQ